MRCRVCLCDARPLPYTQVLLKGIFEATEVKTPTTFIILDEVLPSELTGDERLAEERFEKAMTWLECLKIFGEGAIHGFGEIKKVFGDLMTKETMYFYLVDELTGLPVRGAGYPIVITTPSEIVHKLLPVMQVGMHAMSLYNGVAGVSWMFGYPALRVPKAWCKDVQSSVEMLKQARI